MNASGSTKTCAVTGANGYVGGRLKAHLQSSGLQIVGWTRRAPAGSDAVSFQLGQEVQAKNFSDTTALVHCAYDFKARKWNEIVAKNVRGSEKLCARPRLAESGRSFSFPPSARSTDAGRCMDGPSWRLNRSRSHWARL